MDKLKPTNIKIRHDSIIRHQRLLITKINCTTIKTRYINNYNNRCLNNNW